MYCTICPVLHTKGKNEDCYPLHVVRCAQFHGTPATGYRGGRPAPFYTRVRPGDSLPLSSKCGGGRGEFANILQCLHAWAFRRPATKMFVTHVLFS